MKHENPAAENDREEVSAQRRSATSESERSKSQGRTGPVATLHRSVGNQAVQAASRGEASANQRSADRADAAGGMCDRCQRRAEKGKPLNCPECEAKRHGGEGDRSPALQRLPDGRAVQPSLALGAPDSPYEREAERTADEVLRMEPPGPDGGATGASNGAARAIDRTVVPLDCEECDDAVQPTSLSTVRRRDGDETVTGDVEGRIRSATGGGQGLPAETRSFFEPRFGADFSDVSVHTGPSADRAARSINAEAFTVGTDIAFRSGAYDPSSAGGKRLLAHELTHVVQQTGTGRGGDADRAPVDGGSGDRAVDRIGTNAAPTGVQRACVGGEWQYEIDGCSVPGAAVTLSTLDDRNRPMGEGGPVFGNENEGDDLPCNNHDRCYQTCAPGTSVDESGEWTYDYDRKAACDRRMYRDMMQVCEEAGNPTEEGFGGLGGYLPGDQRVSCEDWAWRYYQGLDTGGGAAFRQRQRQACSCEEGMEGEEPGLLERGADMAGDVGSKIGEEVGEAASDAWNAVESLW